MIRRVIYRALSFLAVRVLSTPCAVWFGSRVLVILPGGGVFTITREDARDLANKLHDAINLNPKDRK